jgi:catechol 2,3-dioxygenase-like lactoylglutathione lyase family enzyme
MPPQLDAFGIVVDDMPRALAFYRELGITLPPDADDQPHTEATLGGGMRLMFDTAETIRSFDPDWQPPPKGRHRTELAFQLDTPAEVDDLYARLTSLGHHGHKAPWDAFWGQRYAIVHDPDGNGVSLYSQLGDAT